MITPSRKDVEAFAKFETEDFELWLRIGLEGYLLEDEGKWAFEPLAVFIGYDNHLVLDLRNIYRVLSPRKQAYFRQAVANLIAYLEATERNVVIFEHLIYLTSVLPAGLEVLRVLPGRICNNFFSLTKNREGKTLFDLTFLMVTELAVSSKDSKECLHALISSPYFDNAYAGIALLALCRADNSNLAAHMSILRGSLRAMFEDSEVDCFAKRRLAARIFDAVSPHNLVKALSAMRLSDTPCLNFGRDNWLFYALIEKTTSRLLNLCKDEGKIYFYCTDNPDVKIFLSGEDTYEANQLHNNSSITQYSSKQSPSEPDLSKDAFPYSSKQSPTEFDLSKYAPPLSKGFWSGFEDRFSERVTING